MDSCSLCWVFTAVAVIAFLIWFARLDADVWSSILTSKYFQSDSSLVSEYSDKVVWVIGASSGIGQQIAIDLSTKYGAKVILSARRVDELKRIAETCEKAKAKYPPAVLPVDILESASNIQSLAKSAGDVFGGAIDVLVLNSGQSQRSLAEETEIEVTKQMIDVNVLGLIKVFTAVLPAFIQRKRGKVLVTSSVAGKLSSALISSYSLTKFALHGYFEGARAELSRHNVSITLACPGPVDTPILKNAFGARVGEKGGAARADDSAEKKMTCERCSDLMIRSTALAIDEVWVAENPFLFFMYFFQFCPLLSRWINKRVAKRRVEAFKLGKDPNFSFLGSIFSAVTGKKAK